LLYPGCARIRYEKPIFAAELFAAGWTFREDWHFPFLHGNLPVLRVFTGLKALVSGGFFVWCAWWLLWFQNWHLSSLVPEHTASPGFSSLNT